MFGFRGRSSEASSRTESGRQGRTLFREAAIKIDSKMYPILDINEQGFVVENYDGDLVPKQRVYFDLLIQLGEREEVYRTEAVVVRVSEKILVCRFEDQRKDAARAIQALIASRAQHGAKRK
ncbi:MAG: hypothetical protein HY060_12135 [Proteobacteria bacterium]|nr:hypothetical protein [Pseudomonadota bacterium]